MGLDRFRGAEPRGGREEVEPCLPGFSELGFNLTELATPASGKPERRNNEPLTAEARPAVHRRQELATPDNRDDEIFVPLANVC